MTEPAEAARRILESVLLGAGLGLYYGSLRPLRQKHPHLSDLLFVPGMLWAWIYMSFATCRGDIRLGYTAALAVGTVAWEVTVGKALRVVFTGIWKILEEFWRVVTLPGKKLLKMWGKLRKKLFAIGRKWVTIKRNRPTNRKGGAAGGKAKDQTGIPQGQHSVKNRHHRRGAAVHSHPSGDLGV